MVWLHKYIGHAELLMAYAAPRMGRDQADSYEAGARERVVKMGTRKCCGLLAVMIVLVQSSFFGQSKNTLGTAQGQYLALPLPGAENPSPQNTLDRYGIPFLKGTLRLSPGVSTRVDMAGEVKQIFLLGMTESGRISAWSDPRDLSDRYFIGDDLGKIRLDYADGSTQDFPLILGESVWFGMSFYRSPEPFPTSQKFQKALAASFRLYPPEPVKEGQYVAVITPKAAPLRSITFESTPSKKGTVVIAGITVVAAGTNNKIAAAVAVPPGNPSPAFEKFVKERALRPRGEGETQVESRLNDLRLALYSSDADLKKHVSLEMPRGYSGPKVSFAGSLSAEILSNAFHYNVQDILDKIDGDGTYHTSTKGAVLWGANVQQFGTFTNNSGLYYGTSWARDMGRSLAEVTLLGHNTQGTASADFALKSARAWEEQASLKYDNGFVPRHWSRVINRPSKKDSLENDGHCLIAMFLYKLWQRLPNRDEWLHAHWIDVKATGDWVLWQFDHPEISGAKDGVLHTTGECAAMNGYSVYADYACMGTLQGLAQMADSIGEKESADRWRQRAGQMRSAMANRYVITDPKYGRVWTLDSAGWPNQSTVLGPLIFLADFQGFAPEDDDPKWRPVNEAAYQRLVDSYKPFGFYGQAMGYGQGFVTQAALLLDRMKDATTMLDWTAKQIYDPKFGSYIVAEGVQIDPTGHFWYRAGDHGNGVQEAEIVKALRIMIGFDDTQPNRLRFFPRMPYGWNEMGVKEYPVLIASSGKVDTALMHYRLQRSGAQMKLEIGSNRDLGEIAMRLGPFDRKPGSNSVKVNGKSQAKTAGEQSGDSWWIRFTTHVGPDSTVVK